MKKDNKLIGAGLFSAFAASLCCITPVLALVAGTSGMASTFSWLDPFRPYFVGLTILVLGFAWYQNLKPRKEMDCGCETDSMPASPGGQSEKSKFVQSSMFLGTATAFALVTLAFPYYSGVFYSKQDTEVWVVDKLNLRSVQFSINGMTCAGCEEHVNHEVSKISGVIKSTASYENGNAVVEFDHSRTNVAKIEKAIEGTGYAVTAKREE